MNAEQAIRSDLSRKLQGEISSVLERNLRVASIALPMHQLAFLMVEAAVMLCKTAAATSANSLSDGIPDEDIVAAYDAVLDTILNEVARSRADGLRRTLAEVHARSAAA